MTVFINEIMTEENSVVIKSIDKNVVNQICSGQVILSLATAVKELLENSMDANATSVQIRLKEYGSETVEVIDNGLGVEEKNFQALTLKHYTSKISDFEDVSSVETFGFRGEALSSLCTLSKVTIVTRHKNSIMGTKLKFDHNGKITESSKTARQIGTTVMLENIFCTLPVRHKEFLRNIRKEFTKMCNVLYAYGLLAKGVNIVCTNQVSSKRQTVMETKGESLKSNITQIFGAKQSQNLLEIKKCVPEDIELEECSPEENRLKIKSLEDIELEGFVSSCTHGCGRSSSDRQFYYINCRPVDNTKISKLVNDTYHQYNPHQYPFVVLNVKIVMKYVDVNVTPDKRLIFMKNEKILLSIIQSSLHKIFKNIPALLKLQNVGLVRCTAEQQSVDSKDENHVISPFARLQQFRSSSYEESNVKRKEQKLSSPKGCPQSRSAPRSTFITDMFKRLEPEGVKKDYPEEEQVIRDVLINGESSKNLLVEDSQSSSLVDTQECRVVEKREDETSPDQKSSPENFLMNKRKATEVTDSFRPSNEDTGVSVQNEEQQQVKRLKTDDGITETIKENRKTMTLDISLKDIEQKLHDSISKRQTRNTETEKRLRFYSQINPSQNESALKELMKELNKDSFKEMNIIGQFNLGFIITSLGPDVFIIDQHATDEKYNFETLQLNTKIQTQKLVVPQNLNLTIEKEELLLHHCDVIRENGFDFTFDSEEQPTRRVKLTSVPLSKNWVFGKQDIDEMLFILENAPDGKSCRPTRVHDMFASRACRKSVMIGTALNHFEMRRLVDHMGEIEQPWNCPHGRPTIRHLINLSMIRN